MTEASALLAVLALAAPSEDFERGKVAFNRGEYARAIEVLSPLVYGEKRLEAEAEIVQTHRMLGVAHMFEKREASARQEFVKLLELKPDFRFDPLLDSPQVVEFFNAIVKDQQTELARIEEARRKDALRIKAAEDEARRRSGRVIVRPVERHSFAVALVPLGMGQFQNGQRGKARAFLISELALGAVSLGTFTSNFALYGLHRRVDCRPNSTGGCDADRTEERTSGVLKWTSFGSGVAFWGVVGWGIVDAVKNFRAEVPAGPDVEQPLPTGPSPRASAGTDIQPAWFGHAAGVEGRF